MLTGSSCNRIAFLHIVTDYSKLAGGKLIEVELQNNCMVAMRVRVNHDQGPWRGGFTII